MPRTATVNYHVHASERQAYHIDAGGVVGKIVSPRLDVTEVQLTDVRTNVAVSFERDSVGFLTAPSTVRAFDQDHAWRDTHDQELKNLLTREVGATEIIIFDHTVRIDDPNATRKPARNVHSDYSPAGAKQRLIDILGEAKAAEWSDGHYGFINVWRLVGEGLSSALCKCRCRDKAGHAVPLCRSHRGGWYRADTNPSGFPIRHHVPEDLSRVSA
ncbi:CmcJ/NvfI family oxidoreductase [Pseudooctadecabacter sp.]|uniref:CmcJ/NvfI family oxidoreductase n=1 Tax=Pseudooctadecabacter sp. TaxID=1966338 RepID=UPI003F6CA9FE